MARRTQPSEDEWRNVEDAKKRKKIQDRLAQRARRQRLREAKNNTKPPEDQDETRRGDGAQPPSEASSAAPSSLVSTFAALPSCVAQDLLAMLPPNQLNIAMGDCPYSKYTSTELETRSRDEEKNANKEEQSIVPNFSDVTVALNPSYQNYTTPSLSHQPNLPLTLAGALYINGQVLGLSCSTVVPAKSSPAGSNVPLSLRPTELQLMTIHPIWIDRFPFPKMRDSMISLGGLVDEEEVLRDVLLMESFEIVPGKPPWDPEAWKIQRPFAEKWGYLFFSDGYGFSV
ncbi:hypothetical protein CC80DRAFT_590150 [Byssothecium circinans]|uniref:BZIP domain-containing protein n=1 Tax=Byssothecium circinans TaxID=147558 RepID=A0A6A5U6P4_9PLEO|nr:hypothetical protein CC80DRAFT_590150 [Byssothecium circinans]